LNFNKLIVAGLTIEKQGIVLLHGRGLVPGQRQGGGLRWSAVG